METSNQRPSSQEQRIAEAIRAEMARRPSGLSMTSAQYGEASIRVSASTGPPPPSSYPVYYVGMDGASEEVAAVAVMDLPKLDSITRIEPEPVQELDLDDLMEVVARDAQDLLGYRPLANKYGIKSRLFRAIDKLQLTTLDPQSVLNYKSKMVECTRGKVWDPTWKLQKLEEYSSPIPVHVLDKAIALKRELPEVHFAIEELHEDPFLLAMYGERFAHIQGVTVKPEWFFGSLKGAVAYIDVWAERQFESGL